MKKVSKSTALVLLILVATTVSSTISLVNAVTANTKLRNEVKAYKAYYNASEALFKEIEDYNENLFDTDKAINYYEAKNKLPISNE
jgi:peptidoglycan hydrolase CwlO-like protein